MRSLIVVLLSHLYNFFIIQYLYEAWFELNSAVPLDLRNPDQPLMVTKQKRFDSKVRIFPD